MDKRMGCGNIIGIRVYLLKLSESLKLGGDEKW
jgi:hypothetical protein